MIDGKIGIGSSPVGPRVKFAFPPLVYRQNINTVKLKK